MPDSRVRNGSHYPPNGSNTDELPVRGVTHHFKWRKAMLAVGHALAGDLDQNCFQTNDIILCGRIRALVQTGQLEISGDLWELRNAKLRLPQA